MQKKTIFLVAVLCASIFANAQEATTLEGRIFSTTNDVSAVHVSNTTANRGTITDANGFFAIAVNLNDTLVFSAVQFKRKEVVVTKSILDSPLFLVPMEDMLTELDEVVLRPYNLTGELNKDAGNLNIGKIITASTLELPNAYVKPPTQSQRKLYAARTWDYRIISIKLDPLINYFSGRTKMLNQRVAREAKYKKTERVRRFFADSVYVRDLKIPKANINDFIYFCEVDTCFTTIVETDDKLKIWEFVKKRSLVYRTNNSMD